MVSQCGGLGKFLNIFFLHLDRDMNYACMPFTWMDAVIMDSLSPRNKTVTACATAATARAAASAAARQRRMSFAPTEALRLRPPLLRLCHPRQTLGRVAASREYKAVRGLLIGGQAGGRAGRRGTSITQKPLILKRDKGQTPLSNPHRA